MPIITAVALVVSDAQRAELARMAAATVLPHRQVVQARALLWAADGVANEEIARRVEVDSDTVRRWRKRFADKGVAGVGVIAKGRGRKPSLPPGTVEEVLRLTHKELPADGSTHWSTRSLAARVGIGKDAVAQIWADHNLKPWKVETFKVSNDPQFEEKLVDFVAIIFTYLDQRNAEARTKQHLREVLLEEAPAVRDAVIDGFCLQARGAPQRCVTGCSRSGHRELPDRAARGPAPSGRRLPRSPCPGRTGARALA
jgi:transposase